MNNENQFKVIYYNLLHAFIYMFVFLIYSGNEKRVYPNILHAIGTTPLVKLNKIPKEYGLKCDVCKLLN